MLVRMMREPAILYEAFGMVSGYYKNISYLSIAERLTERFGKMLSQSQIDELKANALAADRFMKTACADFDRSAEDVKFFFEPFETGDANEVNCIARVLLFSMMGLEPADFDAAVNETKRRWTQAKREGLEVFGFTGYGMSVALAGGRKMPSLFEQIYRTDYPHKAKMDAFLALNEHEKYIDKLAGILRVYAKRLEDGPAELKEVYSRIADRWERELADMPSEEIFELARIAPETGNTRPANAAVSLFIFNEIGTGFDRVPGGADELSTMYLGAAVYPEYAGAFAQLRAEHIAEAMKALGDPVKIAMLQRLRREPDYCLNIANEMSLNAGNVSRHLAALYENGLIVRQRRSGRTYYSTDMEAIASTFSSFIALINKH